VSGETWLLIVAVIGTAALIYFGVTTARDQKLSNSRKDRRLTFLATTITAFALVLSAWQNRLAANDAKASVEASREAAASSKDSADSARASLAIEKAAALTLNCTNGHNGIPQGYYPMGSGTQTSDEPQPISIPPSTHISFLTCVVSNYGRQPVLNAELTSVLNFSPQGQTVLSVTMVPGATPLPVPGAPTPETVRMRIDGIAAGGSYTFWVGDEGPNGFSFQRPLSITFSEPDGTFGSFNFAQTLTNYLTLDARTPLATGEKHGFAKITRMPSLGPGPTHGCSAAEMIRGRWACPRPSW
jgi:hypothetical protein